MTTDPLGRSTFTALGTGVVVLTTDPDAIDAATAAVQAELVEIDQACSRFRADSELERVNHATGRTVAIGPVLVDALTAALRAARLTEGDVDPTIGESLRVLGYDRDFAAVRPSDRPVLRMAAVTGWRQVRLDVDRRTVRIPRGVRLDLGATAKALAADRAATRAETAADCGVLVSLGGDLAVAGPAPSAGWRVRVTDWHGTEPDRHADPTGETVRIDGGGLATSSTTVRRWRRGDETMHHVVDPATGGPAAVVWRTVSVAAASCLDANIATTAAIVRGERALGWLTELGLPARLVAADGTVRYVAGWGHQSQEAA